LQEFSQRYECDVHAYVLMSNHVHLLVSPRDIDGLSEMMRGINQILVQCLNRRHQRCGSLWQSRPKASMVDSSSYLLNCYRYIELNPVRAAMVESPWLYPWSSYAVNASGRPSQLVKPHRGYLDLGPTIDVRQAAYRAFVEEGISDEALGKIRAAISQGWPLGDEAFLRGLQAQGIRSTPGRPGRPKSQAAKTGPELGLAPVLS
jgi:putative transposase